MAADSAVLSLELPPRSEAPAAARRALTALNGTLHLISGERLRDAQLMASELVTNAIVHGGDRERPVRMEVRANEDSMRVTVIDAGNGFDPDRLVGPSPEQAGGWGLPVVASLAYRWGVDTATLKSVWFEID